MADSTSLRSESSSLYHFMCLDIVGTEKTVRKKRIINTVRDNLNSNASMAFITSGSFGEGLQMKGSDLDLMFVVRNIKVHENSGNIKLYPDVSNVVMEMNEIKPGFTLLRCINFRGNDILMELCTKIGKSWYVSGELMKTNYLKLGDPILNKVHGPCLSDYQENMDLAFCFHSSNWIQPAENWIIRGNASWPSRNVKSDIIDHGVLLVPIGCKESNTEALEWRISFSVSEKLLIYSFSHTQLLCYVMMKILLKDLINRNRNCKNLLCSYFIKTIIFWVSEETTVDEWKPENLIRCFMKCFRRLVYCVEYCFCPHYFIPTIDLFENKIKGQYRQFLLGHLKALLSFGWRIILFSEQFQNFANYLNALPSTDEIYKTQLEHLITSATFSNQWVIARDLYNYKLCVRQFNLIKSSFIKSTYLWHLNVVCIKAMQHSSANRSYTNKNIYYKYRKQQSYVLQTVNHDVASGWILLAGLFYNLKQYSKTLYVLNDVLQKCTQENQMQISNLFTSQTAKNLGIFRILRHIFIDQIKFISKSTLIPEELAFDVSETFCILPPLAYVYFLRFLCHLHVKDTRQCYKSLQDLQRTVDENLLLEGAFDKGQVYNLLGIALQLVGKKSLAAQAFMNATKHDRHFNGAAKRHEMMCMQMM